MAVIHHTAICVRDVEASLRFWRDGLGFSVIMDQRFDGDWPTLLHAPSSRLRAVFLGDPANLDAGIVELVDLGPAPGPAADPAGPARAGLLLVSVMADVDDVLARLAGLGLGGPPRRIETQGVAMAVVVDPDGTLVELVDTPARANLDAVADPGGRR